MYGGNTGLATVDNLRDRILLCISPEEIFEYYLNISVSTKKKFRSPLRYDKHPTCSFTYRSGKLLFRDWAENAPCDCFEIVKQIYSCDYKTALNIIAKDFNIANTNTDKPQPVIKHKSTKLPNQHSTNHGTKIRVKRNKEFQRPDIHYLNSYGISLRTARLFDVASCNKIWILDKVIYQYSCNNPSLVYHFGNYHYKIYFYKKETNRFICNTQAIQGYKQLPNKSDTLVITKSLKDVMVLYETGINAIAPQSENVLLSENTIEHLKTRFTNIYTLFDFDRAGIAGSNKYKKVYNIEPVFLTNGRFGTVNYQAKDPAEFAFKFGIEKLKQLIYATQ